MNFRDQIILISHGGEAAQEIAERLLSQGAGLVLLVGETPASAIERKELVWISEAELDTIGRGTTNTAPLDHLDVVINLIEHPENGAAANGATALREGGIQVVCENVVGRTCRVVDATRDLLGQGRSCAAIVNLCCVTRTEAAAASAAAGSLRTLTEALAKELAPQIRVNAVLWENVAGDAGDDGFGPALFLASSAARHVTGTVLTADDGRRLGFAALAKADEPAGTDEVTPNA